MTKEFLRGKFTVIKAYIKKTQRNILNLYFNKLGGKRTKPEVSETN